MTFARAVVALTCLLAASLSSSAAAGSLTASGTIPLPGVRGRLDHLAVDHAGQRLFVAALGNDSVEVVDLASHRAMRSIAGLQEPQGIAYVPELNRLWIANGGDGTLRVLNAAYFGELASIPLDEDADNVRYDADKREIVVGYGAGALAFVDATGNHVLRRAELPVHPESFQLETRGTRVFVNLPNARRVAVVDRATAKITAQWPVAAAANFPMALDASGQRLFVACRSPARLLVLSVTDGHELASAPLHGDCDDLFLAAAGDRVFAACGEGFIDAFAVAPGHKISRTDSLQTRAGARTALLDGDRLYLAVPRRGDATAEIRIFQITE